MNIDDLEIITTHIFKMLMIMSSINGIILTTGIKNKNFQILGAKVKFFLSEIKKKLDIYSKDHKHILTYLF